MTVSEFCLFGIENPLLDVSAIVPEELLAKYELKHNDAILAEDKHKPLFKDMLAYSPQFMAAGAAQNSCRGAQWLLPPKSVVFVGCVGKDSNSDILRQAAGKEGLRTEYLVDEELPTGVCACLITGTDRSMVTDLLAANAYKIDHLKKPDVWALVENAKYFYVGGYFLTVCPPAALLLAEHALEKGKHFCLNLSAPFIPQFFGKPLMELLPYTDLLFGNETEARSFSDAQGFGTQDLQEIALKTASLFKKNASRPRVVVFTQGHLETIVVIGEKVLTFPIIPVARESIVDTTGAGDAFTGGFLSQYVNDEPIEKCVAAGNYVACKVIQASGPTYPSEPHSFKY